MSHQVIIWQNNERKELMATEGQNLFELLLENDISLDTPCGGQGNCGKCKVRVLSAHPSLTSQEEKLLSDKEVEAGVRLACLVTVTEDMELEVEDKVELDILTEGISQEVDLDSEIRKVIFEITQPNLDDQSDFMTRVQDKTATEQITLKALQQLDQVDKEGTLTATINEKTKELIGIEAGEKEELYGVAVDIGTTTVVLYLIDLTTGEEVDTYSFHNPQKAFGADVISRVNYTLGDQEKVQKLQDVLIKKLNEGILSLADKTEIETDDILTMTLVGNTIMIHTLTGVSAGSIAKAPYTPIFTQGAELDPVQLGLKINSAGIVKLVPSISGYVGSDIVGDMLAVDFNSFADSWNLVIDIGTNGEMVLGNQDEIYACATAAGPAFEGAKIMFGVAGIPGAISKYEIMDNGEIEYQTIEDQPAKGICGSGLLDIVAELLTAGFLNSRGAFCKDEELESWQQERMTEYKGFKSYIVLTADEAGIEEDILVTQKDIREIQLAKGSIAAGIEVLLKEADIDYEMLDNLYLAGGFGNYLDPHNACVINLLPQEVEDKIIQIGNGAGIGAKMYLIDQKMKSSAEQLQKKVNYIELSSSSHFQTEFMNSMEF
ncbi:ASKHA domain-containing protein [Natroniella sulfidigena]|uniref:ASKHA domain-containing protein n=1 Tax=Natroniella sulfidigena TaxID=723921 RepID=UPI00200B45FA|nr:ASKHA domain-containing protein [Natroniella sulfidigena]MCK8817845.1 ASKHA domain-containing protein [Natroniella sulfidigena]